MIRDIKTIVKPDVNIEIKAVTPNTSYKTRKHYNNDTAWKKIPVIKTYKGSIDKLYPFMQHLAESIFNDTCAKVKLIRWNYVGHKIGYYFTPE